MPRHLGLQGLHAADQVFVLESQLVRVAALLGKVCTEFLGRARGWHIVVISAQ